MKKMLISSLVALLSAAVQPLSAAVNEFPSAAEIAKLSDAERLKLAEKTEVWQPVPAVVFSW